VATGRELYADAGVSWESGFGASAGEGAAAHRSVWQIRAEGAAGFRIRNRDVSPPRELYAATSWTGAERFGAGHPVGWDGIWNIERQPNGHYTFRNTVSNRTMRDMGAASGGLGADEAVSGVNTLWRLVPEFAPGANDQSSAQTATPQLTSAPLSGTVVTIKNEMSGRVLYATAGADPTAGFGARKPPQGGDDERWRLTDAGTTPTSFRITNVASGRALYADGGNWEHGVGAGSAVDAPRDGTWLLKPQGSGARFRIVSRQTERSLFARDEDSNDAAGVGAGRPEGAVGGDGVWILESAP